MNEEIKEILEEPKILQLSYGNYISVNDYFKLKDYITNLQEEKEHNYETIEKYSKAIDRLKEEKEDYKSRCEKAVEYINKNKHLSMFADCREPEEDWAYDLEIDPRDLLNILQNGSEK